MWKIGQYLLTYFLGNVPDEYRHNIQKLADRLGLEVVNLSETKGTKYYEIGPQHFLYVLHHADYICTDSFHGSVFSILFENVKIGEGANIIEQITMYQ